MPKAPDLKDEAIAAVEAAAKKAEDAIMGENWDDPAPAAAPAPKSEFDADVKVRCIVHTRPHTDKKGLAFEEVAEVSQDVAAIMLKRKQVELV